ncbi:plasmid mobilization protein [Halovulum sp. GXIMD14794]
MGRPKKPTHDKARRREVYATPTEWSVIEAGAAAAELTVSRYLVAAGLQKRVGKAQRRSPRRARFAAGLGRIQAELERVASAVETGETGASSVFILARLARIEALLADLVEGDRS